MYNIVIEHIVETQLFASIKCSGLDLVSCSLGRTAVPGLELMLRLEFLGWIMGEIVPLSMLQGTCQSLGTWLHDRSHPLRHWVINKSVMYKPSRPEKLLAFWLPKSPRSSMKPMFGLSVSSRRSISDNKCLLAGHWTGPHLLDNHTTHDDWIYDCNVHQNACFIICIQFRLSPNLLSTSRSHLFDVGWLYASSQFWCIFFPPLQQSCQRFVKTFTAKEQKTSSCPLSLLKITWSSWLALFLLTLPQLWFEVLLNLVPPCIFVEHH